MVDHLHEQWDRHSDFGGFSTLSVRSVMKEVDAPPQVFDQPESGICVECRGPVEAQGLPWNRVIQTCLSCLTRREREALERDLDLAARVQRQLLPPQNLRVGSWEVCHYYRPSGVASGDICDVIHGGEDVDILIGDVSGKGVAASLLAANLQGLFRTLLPDGTDLASSLARANRIFNATTAISQYATLVCLEASASGEIMLISRIDA